MADYRFAAQIIARSQGRSATAAAAYRSGGLIKDVRTGEVHDYTRKSGIEWSGVMAPEGAPTWAIDRERLWNMVEQREVRKDAQLAREVQLSLPHELTFEQRRALVCDFVQREIVGRGMVADIAMHKPDRGGDQRNFHVHILLTTRQIDEGGFGKKNRNWNSREELSTMRAAWAEIQNEHLRRHLGPTSPQVTHLSYAERGIDMVATVHLGPMATGMERRGIETFLGNHNRDVGRRNQTSSSSRKRMIELENQLNGGRKRSFSYIANDARLEARKAIEEKRVSETLLRETLARKKALAVGSSRKALEAQVLGEAKAEVRRLKKRLANSKHQARKLRKRARSLSQWITNPTRIIWIKIAELHQRDRLEAALHAAEAGVSVRLKWLNSSEGKAWLDQGRRASDWDEVRSTERRIRRHVRRAERRAADALSLAHQAESLAKATYGRANLPTEVELFNQPDGGARYLQEMQRKVDNAIQRLPADVRASFVRLLENGRGRAD